MVKEGEAHFLTYLQKLFSSVHCAYRKPQTKLGADTLICNKNWSRFHAYKL